MTDLLRTQVEHDRIAVRLGCDGDGQSVGHVVKQRHPLKQTAGQAQTRGAGFLAQASD